MCTFGEWLETKHAVNYGHEPVHALVGSKWVTAMQISCPCQRVAGVCPAQQRSPTGTAPVSTSATGWEKGCEAPAARKVWTWNSKDLLVSDRQVLLCPSRLLCAPSSLCPWKPLSVRVLSFVSLHTLLYPCTLLCVPGNHSVSLKITLCPCTPLCAPNIGCHIHIQNILLWKRTKLWKASCASATPFHDFLSWFLERKQP